MSENIENTEEESTKNVETEQENEKEEKSLLHKDMHMDMLMGNFDETKKKEKMRKSDAELTEDTAGDTRSGYLEMDVDEERAILNTKSILKVDADFFENQDDPNETLSKITGMTDDIEEDERTQTSVVKFSESEVPRASNQVDKKPDFVDKRVSILRVEAEKSTRSIDSDGLMGSIAIIPEDEKNHRRKSKKSAASYNFESRIKLESLEDLFASFEVLTNGPDIVLEEEAPEEEEVSVFEEEEEPQMDRAPFYEKYEKFVEELPMQRMKNNLFHKKLAMHYKRKKMDYVVRETDVSYDTVKKYFKKLEAYGELLSLIGEEKARVYDEIRQIRKDRNVKTAELNETFKKMQQREAEVGYGLINTKTGHTIPDKHVERLVSRQNKNMQQVSSMRLTYIKLKVMIQEKMDEIKALEEVAPGLFLGDYDQMKVDNRSYADKIEEKDEELTRLRVKTVNITQVLAHLREKIAEFDNDLEDLIYENDMIEADYQGIRYQLNELKQKRDYYRHRINKMREESGLLTQPTLLKDMEQAFKDIEKETEHLRTLKDEHRKRSNQAKNVRKKMEDLMEVRKTHTRRKTHSIKLPTKPISGVAKKRESIDMGEATFYKGRPSLMMPVIDSSEFTALTTIKPRITFDRSRKSMGKHNLVRRKIG
ncbi:coiled-coil domain-containing protein 96-like isoform X2 [Sitophilus oryzae]|uniref:Coiled-coil domain-containing protein 96-like isoform X2 n=1 Tax=Sitophilus oryzae TaxID=7048 RepID=A0A6J2XTB6_SITOR|nr:coiled-coil domain-containing protein 96-like isoform X2 [Sitophilus oryzae]